ncbi:response regulator transcription factor [Rhodococcus sp. ARC_M6]|uniref:response regulator transcription factor n=1 Tax=Rhodococcus sp. ARC_M6 TaxID=2928852 RepID=UPI001FB2CF68|nr:response regulator transcription factor [Rhodococcus sp. ARC_M6]MCJ0904469.1 response regulator transcription factor [Rhodococcus sp. ARC_M6]
MSMILAATAQPDTTHTFGVELAFFGHTVHLFGSGRHSLNALGTDSFDVAVLDLSLPDIDGFEVARQIRLRSEIPIIMVVESSEDIEDAPTRVASDFAVSPVSARDLDFRVTSLLRTTPAPRTDKRERHGELQIDRRAMTASVGGRQLDLTRTELRVLLEMSGRPGHVYSRDQLLAKVWGESTSAKTRAVDANIQSLRAKIESDSARTHYIKTVRGFGYRFGPVD